MPDDETSLSAPASVRPCTMAAASRIILILHQGATIVSDLQAAARSAFRLGNATYEKIILSAPTHPEWTRQRILGIGNGLAAYAILPNGKIDVKIAVFDTDSTFINQEVIDEIADFAGFKPEVARITELAMQGKLDFNAALAERVALLKGLPQDSLQQVRDTRLSVTNGGPELINDLRERGVKTYLLSGGFSFFTSALREKYAITGDFANELEILDNKLTGRTTGPIVNRQRKAELLRELAIAARTSLPDTIAIGDGANDIDMALASGLGIAFCAKTALVEATQAAIFERDLRLVSHLVFN